MPVSPANTIIRDYPNIIIDENYDDKEVISKEMAMEQAKEMCRIGLENLSITLKENLIASGESPDRLDDDFKNIEGGRLSYQRYNKKDNLCNLRIFVFSDRHYWCNDTNNANNTIFISSFLLLCKRV